MPRFYIRTLLVCDQNVTVSDPIRRHLQVLRLQVGDAVTLFNGQGGEYHGTLLSVGKRTAEIAVISYHSPSRESPLKLTIVQALSAVDRMDYTIQKSTECGVHAIQPIISARSQYRGARADKKFVHWQAIAISASEQCGRTHIPALLPLQTLSDYLSLPTSADCKLILSPSGTRLLQQLPEQAGDIHVLIGPEGGFSAEEESHAIAVGFTPLTLGQRILRTETVAPVMASLLQYRYGDFN